MKSQPLSVSNARSIKRLATVSQPTGFIADQTDTGYAICRKFGRPRLGLFAISPDNQHLACASYGNYHCSIIKRDNDDREWIESCLSIVDYTRNKIDLRFPYLGVYSSVIPQGLEYSPDGKYLAFDDGSSLYVWDLHNYGLVLQYPHIIDWDRLENYGPFVIFPIINLRFLNVGERLYLYVANFASIQIIAINELGSATIEQEFPYEYALDIERKLPYELEQNFPYLSDKMLDRRFLSPNGQFVVTIPQAYAYERILEEVYEREERNLLYLRTVPGYEIIWSHPVERTFFFQVCQAICFHPSSELLAVGQRGQVSIFRIPEGELVCTLRLPRDSDVASMAFSPNGELLAMSLFKGRMEFGDDGEVTHVDHNDVIYDWQWGAPIVQLSESWEIDELNPGNLSFSLDGSRLVICRNQQLEVWGLDYQESKRQNQNRRRTLDDFMDVPGGYESWDDYWDSTPD